MAKNNRKTTGREVFNFIVISLSFHAPKAHNQGIASTIYMEVPRIKTENASQRTFSEWQHQENSM